METLEIKIGGKYPLTTFEYFEYLYVNSSMKDLEARYKTKINETKIENIKLYFKRNKNSLITKNILRDAIGRFISRKLVYNILESNSQGKLLDQLRWGNIYWPQKVFEQNSSRFTDFVIKTRRIPS